MLHGRIPAGRWSATLWVKVTPVVAAGSPARPDARNHVASAGPRQRASPPSAFLRSEAPGPPHPSPVCLHLKGAACGCCRPSCLRFVPKGPSRPWGLAPRGPRLVSLGAWAPVELASHPSSYLGQESLWPWPCRFPGLIWFVSVGSWAAPPANAGIKTLLPVPTYDGERRFVIFMFVSLFSISIHSFSEYILRACCMPDCALSTGAKSKNKRPPKSLLLWSKYIMG